MFFKLPILANDTFEVRDGSVEISVIRRGIPSFDITGVPYKQGIEMKNRIKSAIIASGLKFPAAKIIIHFSNGSEIIPYQHAELQIALCLVCGPLMKTVENTAAFCGQLCQDGSIQPTKFGDLFHCLASKLDYQIICLNADVLMSFPFKDNLKALKVQSLSQAYAYLMGESPLSDIPFNSVKTITSVDCSDEYFGNYKAKRCLEIAIAGAHNLLLVGPPGVGKTSLVSYIKYLHLLDPVQGYETYIQNLLEGTQSITVSVPIVIPPAVSNLKQIFGPNKMGYGLLNKAHKGYVFMDEFLDFSPKCLDNLKNVLDLYTLNGRICQFSLIAACNPCRCGNYGSAHVTCTCTPNKIKNYRAKLSGGLLNRFHLMTYVDVSEVHTRNYKVDDYEWLSTSGKRIAKAQASPRNDMYLHPQASSLLNKVTSQQHLSTRTINNVKSVATTIALLDQSGQVTSEHMLEALSYKVDFFSF